MARTAMTFTISGDKEFRQNLQQYGRKGVVAAMRGVRATAVDILADAKSRLSNNGSRTTSKLFNSGKVTIDEQSKDFVDVIFSGGGDGYTDYAEYVEFGRRAGKMPPLEAITEWVVKKGLADTYNYKTRRRANRSKDKEFNYRAMSIAFLIAKKIAKKGTKARPFLFPAFEAKKGGLVANIEKELDKLNNEMTK